LAEIRTEIGELQGDMSLTMILTKRITKHILYALEYLHDVCGIIHGGMYLSFEVISIVEFH